MAGVCLPAHPGGDHDISASLLHLDPIELLLSVKRKVNANHLPVFTNLQRPCSVWFDFYESGHGQTVHRVSSGPSADRRIHG